MTIAVNSSGGVHLLGMRSFQAGGLEPVFLYQLSVPVDPNGAQGVVLGVACTPGCYMQSNGCYVHFKNAGGSQYFVGKFDLRTGGLLSVVELDGDVVTPFTSFFLDDSCSGLVGVSEDGTICHLASDLSSPQCSVIFDIPPSINSPVRATHNLFSHKDIGEGLSGC